MRGKRLFSAFVALLVVSSAAGLGIAATASSLAWNDSDADAPDPYARDDLTFNSYKVSWDGAPKYYNDNGEAVRGDFSFNTTGDNPYTFPVSKLEASELGAFPRSDGATALNESSWSISGSNSSKLSVTDATPADGVEAVQIATDGSMASGDTATASYSNFSAITSDVGKRVLKVGGSVNTLDSGAVVEVRAVDSDGDYVEVTVNSSADASTDPVLASSTGEAVAQARVADLTVQGSGDGTMSEIASIEVNVQDGDADLTLNWIDVATKSETVIAEQKKDTDSDDELETVEVTDPTSKVSTYSISTIAFSDGTLHSLTAPVKWRASDLPSGDVMIETSSADKYSYEKMMTAYFRIEVPAQLDLSHANLALEQDTMWPEGRYVDVDVIEGAGDTEFKDLDWDNNGADVTSQYSNDVASIDSTVQTDTEYAIRLKFVGSSSEIQAMIGGGSGGGGFFGGSGGGAFGGILDWVAGGLMGLAGLLGLKKGRS